MKDPIKLSDRLSAGGQPTADDLGQLAKAGFKSVVNLRTEGEKNQPLSPDAERTVAVEAGLGYRHVPVSVASLSASDLDTFRKAIEELPGPVYVHCGAGQRACAFSLLVERQGESPETIFKEAEQKGIDLPDAPVRDFMRDGLKSRYK